ncbi:hypothetical protein RvY_13721, partial [Ramazzottius varieornatus]
LERASFWCYGDFRGQHDFSRQRGFPVKSQISDENVDCISDLNTKFLFPISTDNLVDKWSSFKTINGFLEFNSTVGMCANLSGHASKVSLASTSQVKLAQRKLVSRNRSSSQKRQN